MHTWPSLEDKANKKGGIFCSLRHSFHFLVVGKEKSDIFPSDLFILGSHKKVPHRLNGLHNGNSFLSSRGWEIQDAGDFCSW